MGFWAWLGRTAGVPDTDGPGRQFHVSADDVSDLFAPVDRYLLDLRGALGRPTRRDALSIPAVQRGRNLLCSVATLPLRQVDDDNVQYRWPLLDQIDPNVPNIVTLSMTVEDLLFDKVSWWRVTARDYAGYPTSAQRQTEGTVHVRDREVYIGGERVPWRDLIRFDSPNPAFLDVGARAIRRALLLDLTVRMYAEDPQAREFFTAAEGVDPDDEGDIDEFLAEWRAARKKRSVAYVPSWAKHETAGSVSAADLQLVELKRDASLDLANALGVDPEELGVSTTSRTYANNVDRRRDRINDVLAPFMRAITDRLSMGDVTTRGKVVRFLLDDYLKSNPTERWAVYEKAATMGVMDTAEIRQTEGLPPAAASEEAGGATVTPIASRGVAAGRRAAHGFADAREHTFRFDRDPGHRFSVDTEKRTITGVALPYGAVAVKYGLKYRFRPGSLQYGETSRVKHFKDHITPVGKALQLDDTDTNLTAKLSVSAGPTGDELLQLADDEVYDGLSVGVDFSLYPDDGDVMLGEDGVYEVVRADLREISTTPMPAFDDARVTSVAASRTPGGTMKCTTCGRDHAPGVPCQTVPPVTPPATVALTADQLTAVGYGPAQAAAIAATATAANFSADQIAAVLATAPNPAPGPKVINPTTFTARTEVTDPEPYRFDRRGNLTTGAHEFSTDLFDAAFAKDPAATERVSEWVPKLFAVATGDVDELNPTRQRQDMYVDQRQYRYPLWDAIYKGTLTDITPFVFPAFNAASGLVANHTQGVEPTPGSFSTKNGGTITPTAVSGKVQITRELKDQGGNPQVSNLIWQKMMQAWGEALEAFAVATLDAVTPTAITLTTAAQDAALVEQLAEQLAMLQFIRGGFSMDNAFTQVDLYKALVNASDTTGRKLLPALGATNAEGTVRNRWAGLDVNGVAFLPAWALAASGTVAASSYLFDSQSVWGWASTPQRLDFEYQVATVDVGLWGYKASAVTDLPGIREIIYDPA